eukprot:259815_1
MLQNNFMHALLSALLFQCLTVNTLIVTTSVDADFNPTGHCDYQSNGNYSISNTQRILSHIMVDDEKLKIEFDIKLNDYCNTFCNILYIGNDNDPESLSFSINGVENYLQISVIHNHLYNDIHKWPNATQLLPIDSKYHHIYLLFFYGSNTISTHTNIFKVDNETYYYYSHPLVLFPNPLRSYQLYFSNPHEYSVNADISDICIDASIFDGMVNCGDTISGHIFSTSNDAVDYYFNIRSNTGVSTVTFTSENSSISLYMSILDITYSSPLDIEGGIGAVQNIGTELIIPHLNDGEYKFEIYSSGNVNLYDPNDGYWQVYVTCEPHVALNLTNYQLIFEYYNVETWWRAENVCEKIFGTCLATVLTQQDMYEVINMISLYKKETENISAWIGMYRYPAVNSKWTWIDGTSCNYTVSGKCDDHMFWHSGHPSERLYQNATIQLREPLGAYVLVSTDKNLDNMYDDYEFESSWNPNYAAICNAPAGKYQIQSCFNVVNCWNSMNCCENEYLTLDISTEVYDLVGDDKFNVTPAMAYWNTTLFVVGAQMLHYTKFDLFSVVYEWDQVFIDKEMSCIRPPEQFTAQYESSLYILCHYTYVFGKTYVLIHINLNNLDRKSYLVPQTTLGERETFSVYLSNTPYCMVAGDSYVYIFMDTTILVFNVLYHSWSRLTLTTEGIPDVCVISKDLKFIYLFIWFSQITYKLSTTNGKYTVLKTPNLCVADRWFSDTGGKISGISAKNGNIYLHGCAIGSWKTFVFNTDSDEFEMTTIDVDHPNNVRYYRSSQLTVFDDNVLLLLNIYNSSNVVVYHALTNLISINLEETKLINIWPSDGFIINYYINDFTQPAHFNSTVLLHSNNTSSMINELSIFNAYNDNCICNKVYQCVGCIKRFELSNYLSVADNDIQHLQFYLSSFHTPSDSHPLIIPTYFTVSLQRCNIFIDTNDTFTTSSKPILHFNYSLSPNCYQKPATTFSLCITSHFVNISKRLIIAPIDEITCLICNCDDTDTSNCDTCDNKSFIIKHPPAGIEDKTFQVSFKSNSIDFNVNSADYSFKYMFGSRTYFKQLWYLLFLLIIPVIIVLLVITYCRNQYMNAFIIDKSLVLIIGICQFKDKTLFLDGVKQNVEQLLNLWKVIYNYDVFVCNEDTLYCTKQDVIDFIDNHKKKLENKEYQSV